MRRRWRRFKSFNPAGIAIRYRIIRNIFCHDASRTDYHIIADCNARYKNSAAALMYGSLIFLTVCKFTL